MTKLSKQDQRILDMVLAQAKAGNHDAARAGANAFVRSAPTAAIHAKRKAAVADHITTILPTVHVQFVVA